jgi:hypothetical protein
VVSPRADLRELRARQPASAQVSEG